MKITDNATYLRVALHTLQGKIAPELASGDGKAAAAMLGQVLEELLKREITAPSLLAGQVATGEALAAQLNEFAVGFGIAVPNFADKAGDVGGFTALAARHDELTAQIAAQAHALSDRRAQLPTVAQETLSALLLEVALWDQHYPLSQRDRAVPSGVSVAVPAGEPLSRDLLEAFLRSAHPDGDAVSVIDMQPISGGFGKQTFRTRIRESSGAERALIVRKSDPVPMVRKGAFLVDQEFHLLCDLYAARLLPLAEPLWLAKDFPGVDADFYVMQALPGEVPSSFLGAGNASIPESLILQMAEQMARLHSLELSSLSAYLDRFESPTVASDTVESCYRRQIAEWRDYFHQAGHLPSPFVTYLLDWLGRNVPADPRRPVLLHGDLNIHNVLAENGQITGILDWECAMIGAPEQDLAYVRPILLQHIEWERFLAHYQACGGRQVNAAAMNFCMAFSAMRLCVVFNKGVRNLQDRAHQDIRYAVIDLSLTPEFMKQALACTTG
ncbi:phosphotransferase family protein [Novosphingobium sp.]|uniref:phosphotransferase family protein n=1 Tax=Novosphingobium sp. TaxID=1874826 RepID=UPI00260723FA|nr:phosphotransferase family protein [Novosphingobium sp.]